MFSPKNLFFSCSKIYFTGSTIHRTSVGIHCKDGVVFGTEKIVKSKLLEDSSSRKVHIIARNLGVTFSGWSPDTRKIVTKAREEVKSFKDMYGIEMSAKMLMERVASFVHSYTVYSWLRPFGCATLIAGFDKTRGYELYMVEPSGVSWGYAGVAVGKAKQAAKNELSKISNLEDMTCREAVKAIVSILNEVHDKIKDKEFKCDLGWVCDETKGHFEKVPQELVDQALAEISNEEEEDMEADENLSDVDE